MLIGLATLSEIMEIMGINILIIIMLIILLMGQDMEVYLKLKDFMGD